MNLQKLISAHRYAAAAGGASYSAAATVADAVGERGERARDDQAIPSAERRPGPCRGTPGRTDTMHLLDRLAKKGIELGRSVGRSESGRKQNGGKSRRDGGGGGEWRRWPLGTGARSLVALVVRTGRTPGVPAPEGPTLAFSAATAAAAAAASLSESFATAAAPPGHQRVVAVATGPADTIFPPPSSCSRAKFVAPVWLWGTPTPGGHRPVSSPFGGSGGGGGGSSRSETSFVEARWDVAVLVGWCCAPGPADSCSYGERLPYAADDMPPLAFMAAYECPWPLAYSSSFTRLLLSSAMALVLLLLLLLLLLVLLLLLLLLLLLVVLLLEPAVEDDFAQLRAAAVRGSPVPALPVKLPPPPATSP
uniref:Uncharacterized protein n=1 Tax=Anopheles farauti TaxID=69004 RepID=A0A182Q5Q2_9DIPT